MAKVTIESTSLDLDSSFQTHSTKAGGAGYLGNWKEDGEVTVWFHPQADVKSIWSHPWFGINTPSDDDDDSDPTVGMRRFNCFEREPILLKQRFRDGDEREYPPALCPYDFMIEWVYQEVASGRLDWCEPVFKIEAGEDELVLYAGGITGMFQGKEVSKSDAKHIFKETGVKVSEAYKQTLWARQEYIVRVTPHEDEDSGCVIARIPVSLGNHLKRAFADRREDLGDEGSYKVNPFAVTWKFDDNKDFADKYKAVIKSSLALPAHVAASFKEEPPDLTRLIAPYNLFKFRKELESFCVLDNMPIADFFKPIEKAFGIDTTEDTQSEDEEEAEEEDEEEKETPPPKAKGKKKPEPEEEEDEDEDVEPEEEVDDTCLVCGKHMGDDWEKCKHCGAKYKIVGEEGDEELVLASRKCGNFENCMEWEVPVGEDGTGTCPQCGAVHDEHWNFEVPEKKKTVRKARKASRATARGE